MCNVVMCILEYSRIERPQFPLLRVRGNKRSTSSELYDAVMCILYDAVYDLNL